MTVIRDANPRLAPDSFVADFAPKPLNALPFDGDTVSPHGDEHGFAAAKAGVDHVDFDQQAFDAALFWVHWHGLLSHRLAGVAGEFKLFFRAQLGILFPTDS